MQKHAFASIEKRTRHSVSRLRPFEKPPHPTHRVRTHPQRHTQSSPPPTAQRHPSALLKASRTDGFLRLSRENPVVVVVVVVVVVSVSKALVD
ncbi:hypothetical protein RUM44_002289 [Polyplax serrata]|uniref:Transmembrane protein n=1 Tax=Polyplax serrata TaxID=468196 RepID=A0ABR1AMF7_POLSC